MIIILNYKLIVYNIIPLIIILSLVIDEVKLKEEIMQVNQKIKTLFEEEKVDEIVKHYTKDCKFIFLPESKTISGRSGACGANVVIPIKTHHYTLCMYLIQESIKCIP